MRQKVRELLPVACQTAMETHWRGLELVLRKFRLGFEAPSLSKAARGLLEELADLHGGDDCYVAAVAIPSLLVLRVTLVSSLRWSLQVELCYCCCVQGSRPDCKHQHCDGTLKAGTFSSKSAVFRLST